MVTPHCEPAAQPLKQGLIRQGDAIGGDAMEDMRQMRQMRPEELADSLMTKTYTQNGLAGLIKAYDFAQTRHLVRQAWPGAQYQAVIPLQGLWLGVIDGYHRHLGSQLLNKV